MVTVSAALIPQGHGELMLAVRVVGVPPAPAVMGLGLEANVMTATTSSASPRSQKELCATSGDEPSLHHPRVRSGGCHSPLHHRITPTSHPGDEQGWGERGHSGDKGGGGAFQRGPPPHSIRVTPNLTPLMAPADAAPDTDQL